MRPVGPIASRKKGKFLPACVGCGTGRNFPFLREAIGPTGRIYGVDLSAGMLCSARKLRLARPTKSPGPGAGASCSLACEATGGPSEQRGSRADLHRRRNNAGAARGVPHVAKFSAHGPPREIRRQATDVRLRSPTGVTHACFPPRDEIALLLRLHQSPSAELYCLNCTRF